MNWRHFVLLNRHNFLIAELVAEPDATADPAIAGLLVSPTGTTATDGRQLITVSAPEVQPNLFRANGIEPAEFFTDFILDRESALKIAKAIPNDKETPELNYAVIDCSTENNETATLAIDENIRQEIVKARKIDAKYPSCEKLIPDKDRAKFTIRFNPTVLLPVLKAFDKFAKDQPSPSFTMRLYSAREGIRIDAMSNGQTMTAIVMPMELGEA